MQPNQTNTTLVETLQQWLQESMALRHINKNSQARQAKLKHYGFSLKRAWYLCILLEENKWASPLFIGSRGNAKSAQKYHFRSWVFKWWSIASWKVLLTANRQVCVFWKVRFLSGTIRTVANGRPNGDAKLKTSATWNHLIGWQPSSIFVT